MSEDFKRYALYFAPESGSRLARLGNHWLGTDPETGKELDWPQIDGIAMTGHIPDRIRHQPRPAMAFTAH